jgi:hypothetical protein
MGGPRLGGPALRASVFAASLCVIAAGLHEPSALADAGRSPGAVPARDFPANVVSDVSALSPTDAWAVGSRTTEKGSVATILHWNGSKWAKTPTPQASRSKNDLESVSAVSATDAWAVGSYQDDLSGAEKTLVLHWDGDTWSRVPSPSRGSQVSNLWSVSADSPTDAWAVGMEGNGRHSFGFVLHWDGRRWSRVPVPNPSSEVTIRGVSAISPTDVWAVGGFQDGATFGFDSVVLHWNGTEWARVAHPSPSATDNYLWSVSATSSSDVWTVGDFYTNSRGNDHTLILHWNGKRWSKVPSPNPSSVLSELRAVDAVSPSDAWAVGSAGFLDGHSETARTVVLHWDGASWSQVPSPNPSSVDNEPSGVSATSSDDAWAVGYEQRADGIDATLTLHWDGASWSQVVSPNVER